MVDCPSQIVLLLVVILLTFSIFPQSGNIPTVTQATYNYPRRITAAFSSHYKPVFFRTSLRDTTVCRTVPGLTRTQLDLCQKQPDAAAAAFEGIQQAVAECQHQFQGHRWNCSTLATRGRNPYVSAILQKGFRETAFAYAMISAGVAISVARACAGGLVAACGCERSPRGGVPASVTTATSRATASRQRWKWAGCSHNARYSVKYARTFLDAAETHAEDIRSRVNLHNNHVGRMAVTNNIQVKCKCHGMSGSCELKTCWKTTPDYRTIGNALKEKYQEAVLVDQTNLGKKSIRRFNSINDSNRRRRQHNHPKSRLKNERPRKQWAPRRSKHKRDLSRDLLYYQKSPDFCERERNLDVPGTRGRECNRTTSIASPDSCEALCCGRGYDLVRRHIVERCRCKFVYCCQVECQTCSYEKWVSVCK